MIQERMEEDKIYKESVNNFQSSDESDLEENFGWYTEEDPDSYFCLCTRTKNEIEKDQQVYVCYGRRSNKYLLWGYGFVLQNNKYNSLSIRVWLDFQQK